MHIPVEQNRPHSAPGHHTRSRSPRNACCSGSLARTTYCSCGPPAVPLPRSASRVGSLMHEDNRADEKRTTTQAGRTSPVPRQCQVSIDLDTPGGDEDARVAKQSSQIGNADEGIEGEIHGVRSGRSARWRGRDARTSALGGRGSRQVARGRAIGRRPQPTHRGPNRQYELPNHASDWRYVPAQAGTSGRYAVHLADLQCISQIFFWEDAQPTPFCFSLVRLD
jgi:hypothetical protein